MEVFDLSRVVEAGMPVYPGDTPPELVQTAEFEKDTCVDHRVNMGMHVGTHMDGPMHMVQNGRPLVDLTVDRFLGRGVLIDARGKNPLDVNLLQGQNIQAGDIVLFWTDWDKKFGHPDYYGNFPVFTPRLAEELVKLKVGMIGLDSPSPDATPYTVHRILLAQEILINPE